MRILAVLVAMIVGVLVPCRGVPAFSVLAHQAVVDQCWEDTIVPALQERFPQAGTKDIDSARAYAYGGSHVPDLGYFPLGNVFFTNAIHYVRSGDFVVALVNGAQTIDEYAFALGVLSHYVTDDTGHPEATNRVVAEVYPKLRKQYGDSVTYADKPSAHLMTEFRFDVLQLAHRKVTPDLFKHAIAFEVSKPVLDRAFTATYGLGLADVFANTDVAITTYRWAFRELIHEATGIAWELYRSDIDPTVTAKDFIHTMSRADFEKEFGRTYREPGYFARFFGFLVKLVPNVGPLKRMAYKPLPPEAQEQFTRAFDHAALRYRKVVSDARRHHLHLANETLDTGQPTRPGEYEPADKAYADLLQKLEKQHFNSVSPELRADILRFYADGTALRSLKDDDDARDVHRALEGLAAEK